MKLMLGQTYFKIYGKQIWN